MSGGGVFNDQGLYMGTINTGGMISKNPDALTASYTPSSAIYDGYLNLVKGMGPSQSQTLRHKQVPLECRIGT
jgi:hypothetical protein